MRLEIPKNSHRAAVSSAKDTSDQGVGRMKVVVLGAGVIGVTSAWYLAKAGHEVTVIDRQPAPALETSFANAGEISPGYASPWAAPGIPIKALKWMFMEHAPLIIQPRMDWAKLSWMARMLMNCTADGLCGEQVAHGPAGGIFARLPDGAARPRPGFPMTNARRARCSCSAPKSRWRRRKRTSRSCRPTACRSRCWTPTPAWRPNRAWLAPPQDRRRPAPAGRRDRRLLQVHHTVWPRWPSGGRDLPLGRRHRPAGGRGRPHHRRPHLGRPVTVTAFVLALGSYSPRLAAPSASSCRSIRSRAIRSPFRSSTRPAPRCRP
jgi:hypothetical protein